MTADTHAWSVNALAAELGMDRRTLAKRLRGVAPAQTKDYGNRVERRYYLADVMAHLGRTPRTGNGKGECQGELHEDMKTFLGTVVFPAVLDDEIFIKLLTGSLRDELGLTKGQAVRAYDLTCLAFAHGLGSWLEDDDMQLRLPERTRAIHEAGGAEAYARHHWPEAS